jgi:hypothetical protein
MSRIPADSRRGSLNLDKDGDFYGRKRKIGRFYMEPILPETLALRHVIIYGST